MSRTSDFGKKNSQSSVSVNPTTSFLQTRSFATLQTDFDEDASAKSTYSEDFLGKMINQHSTKLSDTSIQAKPMNRLKVAQAKSIVLQAKLNIGEPNDKYEQEADRTAAQVVQQINSSSQAQSVQRDESMEVEEEDLQMKPDISQIQRHTSTEHESEDLQMKSLVQKKENVGGGEASSDLESSIASARGSGQSLDAGLKEKMGLAMGADFSGVKVHTNSQADQLNKSIQAKAFTTGQDIFFRQGEYDPSSTGGQELLAHELTHVVQQNASAVQRRKKVQMKPKLQRHQEEDEVQMKPKLQRHQEEDEVQMKPQLQRHQEEDEVQMKPQLQMKAESNSSSCQCSSCNPSSVNIQRKIDQSSGVRNLLNRKLVDMVNIQRKVDSGTHCSGCACSGCSSSNNQIQRKSESTHASGCSCTKCSGGKIQAKLIQAKPISTNIKPTVKQSAHSNVIQRHSSWEHQLLGDADPNDLVKIGNWEDLIDKTDKKGGVVGIGSKREMEKAEVVDIDGVGRITKGNVMHVIAQELQRLNNWQKNPPQKGTSGEIDPTYQTVLVSLPGGGKDGNSPFIITYGEMNTLADYYGNVDLMKTADPKARFQLVQSVRQETFFRLKEIYTKLSKSLTSTEKKDQNVKDAKRMMKGNELVNQKVGFKFEGAITPDYISGKAGQVELLKGVQSIGTREDTNQYTPTLARNACHFVPESWHSWAIYHEKAIVKAKDSYTKTNQAQQKKQNIGTLKNFDNQNNFQNDINSELIEIEYLTKEGAELANDAIIDNGFGDHYLQDSYAGGHMINKTKIMQWFVQWLDTKKWTMDYASEDKWRKVQAIAYKQPELASQTRYKKDEVQGYDPNNQTSKAQNPQVVEDIAGDDWMVRFEALGLQVPSSLQTAGTPSRRLMEWWQKQSAEKSSETKQTGKSLLTYSRLNFNNLKAALKALTSDGIVFLNDSSDENGRDILSGAMTFNDDVNRKSFESFKFELRPQYVPKDVDKLNSALLQSDLADDDSEYQKMASAITYQDYMAFMNNAYVQKSTNALHDAFCQNGLEVSSKQGEELFRAYGDDNMFNKGSAKGLKHSGDTAKMSRDSIRNYISTGTDNGISTQDILDRLPAWVKTPKFKDGTGGGTQMSIEDWHDPSKFDNLKSYCESDIFPNMGVIDKVVGMTGDLTNFISKDKAKVHGSDAF